MNSLSSVKKSSVGVSKRSGGSSGMFVFTLPIAVNGFTLCLLTRIERPFLMRSRVPLGKTFETTYGPSHLSSIFSFVFRNSRRSKKTNCPGVRVVSEMSLSGLSLYLSELESAFLVATCLLRKRCRNRLSVCWCCVSGRVRFVEYLGW